MDEKIREQFGNRNISHGTRSIITRMKGRILFNRSSCEIIQLVEYFRTGISRQRNKFTSRGVSPRGREGIEGRDGKLETESRCIEPEVGNVERESWIRCEEIG